MTVEKLCELLKDFDPNMEIRILDQELGPSKINNVVMFNQAKAGSDERERFVAVW